MMKTLIWVFGKLSYYHRKIKGLKMIENGNKAHDFELQDQNNKTVKLSDYLGKKVLLWFYPKSDTPG